MTLTLTEQERRYLSGDEGAGLAFAMRLVVQVAENLGAKKLLDVTTAHCTDAMFTGDADIAFAQKLLELGATAKIPMTLNAGLCDLVSPERGVQSAEESRKGRMTMELYQKLGGKPIFTCAPFQEPKIFAKPNEDVAWGESAAIPILNAVIGARTNRYGSFFNVAAGITGKAPAVGLHLKENRYPQVKISLDRELQETTKTSEFYSLLGLVVGDIVGNKIPLLNNLPEKIIADNLKEFAAAAATSGSLLHFHIPKVTYEMRDPEFEQTVQEMRLEEVVVTKQMLLKRKQETETLNEGTKISAVALGAPHLSNEEVLQVSDWLRRGNKINKDVYFSMAISRSTKAFIDSKNLTNQFENAGIDLVLDRCSYFPGVLSGEHQNIVTNSAKWALYGRANLGVDVGLRSIDEALNISQTGVLTTGSFA